MGTARRERHGEQTCYISAPARARTEGLRRALKELGVRVLLEGETPAPGESLIVSLREALARADFVCGVLDAEEESANVLFELGLAVGLGRPLFIVQAGRARSAPVALEGYPRVQAGLDDIEALKFHLRLFLPNTKRVGRAPLTKPLPKALPRAAGDLDDLHDRNRRTSHLAERDLERVVLEAIQRAGIEVVARPQYGQGDREVQPDLAVWLADAPPDLGNPILVELVGAGRSQGAVEQAGRYLEAARLRCALVICATPGVGPPRAGTPGYVFQLSLDDFLIAIEQGSLVQRLVEQRNQLVHGGR